MPYDDINVGQHELALSIYFKQFLSITNLTSIGTYRNVILCSLILTKSFCIQNHYSLLTVNSWTDVGNGQNNDFDWYLSPITLPRFYLLFFHSRDFTWNSFFILSILHCHTPYHPQLKYLLLNVYFKMLWSTVKEHLDRRAIFLYNHILMT